MLLEVCPLCGRVQGVHPLGGACHISRRRLRGRRLDLFRVRVCLPPGSRKCWAARVHLGRPCLLALCHKGFKVVGAEKAEPEPELFDSGLQAELRLVGGDCAHTQDDAGRLCCGAPCLLVPRALRSRPDVHNDPRAGCPCGVYPLRAAQEVPRGFVLLQSGAGPEQDRASGAYRGQLDSCACRVNIVRRFPPTDGDLLVDFGRCRLGDHGYHAQHCWLDVRHA
mmetsp:Transcript_51863/g.136263  ORF Transcript_51863/g.136263 Transcript_51863/m.136263 type:complete len:223 (-) Transcript_51863:211-879(-)